MWTRAECDYDEAALQSSCPLRITIKQNLLIKSQIQDKPCQMIIYDRDSHDVPVTHVTSPGVLQQCNEYHMPIG